MIIKTLKWLFLGLLAVILLCAAVLHFSARAALDKDFHHSAAVAELPLFDPASSQDLVRIPASGFEFRARVANFGADNTELPGVILLHGWPETSAMWLDMIPELKAAGYRVVAFDQRGYSPGARPEGWENYSVSTLVGDILAVADAAGFEEFHLVGHDWGAIVGWATTIGHPDRVRSWTALSIAHPKAFGDAIQNDPDQAARSRYVMLFATPWLAESVFLADDMGLLKATYASMGEDQLQEYLAVFSEPGAMTGGFNWYRAAARSSFEAEDAQDPMVETPTLFIWGRNDVAAGPVAVEATRNYMRGPYRKVELEAGHWLMEEVPEPVVRETLTHIRENTGPG